jgi:hypothetical protein
MRNRFMALPLIGVHEHPDQPILGRLQGHTQRRAALVHRHALDLAALHGAGRAGLLANGQPLAGLDRCLRCDFHLGGAQHGDGHQVARLGRTGHAVQLKFAFLAGGRH